jgi:hypothetical protein
MTAFTSSASLVEPFLPTTDGSHKPSLGLRLIRWLTAGEPRDTYPATFETNPNTFSIEFERRLLGQ